MTTATKQLPLIDMREGLVFLGQANRKTPFRMIWAQLDNCSEKYGGCEDCPDKHQCDRRYDYLAGPQPNE